MFQLFQTFQSFLKRFGVLERFEHVDSNTL
jgi:hypothetical protein